VGCAFHVQECENCYSVVTRERPTTQNDTLMERTNPATGETIETYDEHDDGQVEDRLSRAESTFETFRDWSVAERETKLAEVATLLRDRTAEYAELITREMGKPIAQAEAEVEKCAGSVITMPSMQDATSRTSSIRARRDRP